MCFRRNSEQPFSLDALERRSLFAAHPVAVNFNDEALWDANFSTAVNQAQNLGVSAVRVWVGVPDWNARPNAWDPIPEFGTTYPGDTAPDKTHVNTTATAMRRAFDLNRAGFSVLFVVNGDEGAGAPSLSQVQGFFRHLRGATESPTGTQTLADVVDYWEVGNEPDLSWYWAPSGINKTSGLKSYVNDFLIPAADVMHEGSYDEKIVSAGVSSLPSDLKTILDELSAKGRLDAIDFAGFHPYGKYDPMTGVNEVRDRTTLAKTYATAVGKNLMATEWNVRGYSVTGSQDTQWAAATDYIYRNVILPNYEVGYYFALLNNYDARSKPSTTSARPAGVLEHSTALSVTPDSSIASLKDYYQSPLVAANPYYDTFNAWQYGALSGAVVNAASGSTAVIPTTSVYIDVDNDGTYDAGEPTTTTGAGGAFTLKYSSHVVTAGQYFLRVVTPAGWLPATNAVSVALANLKTQTGVSLSLTPQDITPPTDTLGTIAGIVWNDADADRVIDLTETPASGKTVYLDIDNDSVRDTGEPLATTGSTGAYLLTFNPADYTVVAASLRVDQGTGYETTTPAPLITIAAGTRSGINVGVRSIGGSTPSSTGSISGVLWNDSDGDGIFDSNESLTGARVVYIDANKNGLRDATEKYVNSNTAGVYKFSGLVGGTYYVTREFPSGYHMSNSANKYLTVNLGAGLNITNANIGTTDKGTVGTGGTIGGGTTGGGGSTGGGTTTPTGTASIKGTFFSAKSSYAGTLFAKAWTVYVDLNKNGKLDTGEKPTTVASDHAYGLTGLGAGTFRIAVVAQTGWNVTTPTSRYYDVTLTAGKAVTGKNYVLTKV